MNWVYRAPSHDGRDCTVLALARLRMCGLRRTRYLSQEGQPITTIKTLLSREQYLTFFHETDITQATIHTKFEDGVIYMVDAAL